MKKLICAFLILGVGFSCSRKKFEYSFPPNLEESKKGEFVSFIHMGRKLYDRHCAKCHGKSYKSMDGQDQFTENQIRNYAVHLKIRNETHKFTKTMTLDDVDAICVYLTYRK